MTREEAIRKHREMWNWLADNPGMMKWDYLQKFDPEATLVHECYLCEYTDMDCTRCPLEWAGRDCPEEGSLYNEWCYAVAGLEDYTRTAEIARQIAELPEKEEEIE